MHKISQTLNILMVVLFLLLFLNGTLVLNYHLRTNHDTALVNKLGIIRGSIQRYTKRELAGIESPEIESQIEFLFSEIETNLRNKITSSDTHSFHLLHYSLKQEYLELKKAIQTYRGDPVPDLRSEILEKSESIWELADSTVFEAHLFFESMRKTLYFHLAGMVLALCLVILLILHIKRSVRDKLEQDAHFDRMSGALNKATFQSELDRRIDEAQRYGRSFSLILLDIDKFKQVNDTFGHAMGDQVINGLSKEVRKNIRTTDLFGRIGGEEFAVLAPETDVKRANILAEKIRCKIEQSALLGDHPLTVSIGVTEYKKETDSAQNMYERADAALYQAKRKGRNRVIVA